MKILISFCCWDTLSKNNLEDERDALTSNSRISVQESKQDLEAEITEKHCLLELLHAQLAFLYTPAQPKSAAYTYIN